MCNEESRRIALHHHLRPIDVKVLYLLRLEGRQLQPVEVLQQLLDLVRPVDVRDGVDPVPGGVAPGGAHVRVGHGVAPQAALPRAHAAQGAAALQTIAVHARPEEEEIILGSGYISCLHNIFKGHA